MGQFPGKNTNMEPYWDLIKRIVTESDIVLEVIDARLVELSRNEEVERLIEEIGRPVIYVVNKSDLVNKEKLREQIKPLEDEGKNIVFVSNRNKKSYKILLYNIRKLFSKCGKREMIERHVGDPKQRFREAKADIVVGILGYPNVGKSSIINGLTHKKKVKVSKKAGTTHGIHWIKLDEEMKLIDSPGVIPLKNEDEVRYGLIGARDSARLKNPEIVANAVIKLFIKNNLRAFEKHFDISIEDCENDFYSIIDKIGNRRRYLLKGNRIDENRVCQDIIRDWQQGSLRL